MDRVTELVVEALKLALARGEPQRLARAGKLDGLFPGRTGPAAEAAALALRQGLLEVVRTETRGKTALDWVRLTPAGVDYLHERESPVRALHELREGLRLNRQAVPAWLDEMRAGLAAVDARLAIDAQKWAQRLEALERRVEDALRRIEAAQPVMPAELAQTLPWAADAVNYLDRRRTGGAAGDCPLPELFAALGRHHPALTVASYHDGLRRLAERRVIRLADAPDLAALDRPEFALLTDGRVRYFAAR